MYFELFIVGIGFKICRVIFFFQNPKVIETAQKRTLTKELFMMNFYKGFG